MFDWIEKTFDTLAQYFLDLFEWFFEFVWLSIEGFLNFFKDLAVDLVIEFLGIVKPLLPPGLLDSIVESYTWFQYADGWVPLSYGFSLLLAYYGIAVGFYIIRFLVSLLPVGKV